MTLVEIAIRSAFSAAVLIPLARVLVQAYPGLLKARSDATKDREDEGRRIREELRADHDKDMHRIEAELTTEKAKADYYQREYIDIVSAYNLFKAGCKGTGGKCKQDLILLEIRHYQAIEPPKAEPAPAPKSEVKP